jgi:hypothetical protein
MAAAKADVLGLAESKAYDSLEGEFAEASTRRGRDRTSVVQSPLQLRRSAAILQPRQLCCMPVTQPSVPRAAAAVLFSCWAAQLIRRRTHLLLSRARRAPQVLQELASDKALERFKIEYEKLYRALRKSHGARC